MDLGAYAELYEHHRESETDSSGKRQLTTRVAIL